MQLSEERPTTAYLLPNHYWRQRLRDEIQERQLDEDSGDDRKYGSTRTRSMFLTLFVHCITCYDIIRLGKVGSQRPHVPDTCFTRAADGGSELWESRPLQVGLDRHQHTSHRHIHTSPHPRPHRNQLPRDPGSVTPAPHFLEKKRQE
jgi:hypothetical protein